eukprot:362906-Chlamydomonas_euryale.AAC.2
MQRLNMRAGSPHPPASCPVGTRRCNTTLQSRARLDPQPPTSQRSRPTLTKGSTVGDRSGSAAQPRATARALRDGAILGARRASRRSRTARAQATGAMPGSLKPAVAQR